MRGWIVAVVTAAWMLGPAVVRATSAHAGAGSGVGVDEHPGERLPPDLTFRIEDGSRVRLGDLLGGTTPTVLVLAYFRCPMLCDQIVAGLVRTLPATRVATGVDYRALIVSFDPKDAPEDAAAKAGTLLAGLSPFERARWRFVVDDDGSAARLAGAVGFRYRYDRSSDQYAHPALAVALSPAGGISRYLYGVSFPPDLLASALRDAAGGHATGTLERVLLTCFQYVPALQRHANAVAWVLRGGTSVLFAGLGLSLVWLVRRQHRRRASTQPARPGLPPSGERHA